MQALANVNSKQSMVVPMPSKRTSAAIKRARPRRTEHGTG